LHTLGSGLREQPGADETLIRCAHRRLNCCDPRIGKARLELGRGVDGYTQGADDGTHERVGLVEVTVGGPLDPETGMVVNLKHVDGVLRREFIDAVDHRHLNRDVEFLRGIVPTAENVALAAFRRLEPLFSPAKLERLRLVESENNAAEVIAG